MCEFFSGVPDLYFSHQRISQSVVQTSLEIQLGPWGPTASQVRSVPVFLRTPIATCDFPGGPDPLSPL